MPLPYAVPDDISDEEKALLDQARAKVRRVEQRMLALARAASERWRPAQSVYETDETAEPVFSDEEYADFLAITETMAEAAVLRAVGGFFRLPKAAIDDIVHTKLKAALVPPPLPSRNPGIVVRRGPPVGDFS